MPTLTASPSVGSAGYAQPPPNGNAWSNPSRIVSRNQLSAVVTIVPNYGSDGLRAESFGLAALLPADTTLDALRIELQARSTALDLHTLSARYYGTAGWSAWYTLTLNAPIDTTPFALDRPWVFASFAEPTLADLRAAAFAVEIMVASDTTTTVSVDALRLSIDHGAGAAALPLTLGATPITAVSLGSTPITAIHLGAVQVWP
jgi:hypothetical protein